MSFRKKSVIISGCAILLCSLLAIYFVAIITERLDSKEIYHTVTDAAVKFPQNIEDENCGVFFLSNSEGDYLIVQNEGKRVLAYRSINGETLYYFNSNWFVYRNGTLSILGDYELDIISIAKAFLEGLANDQNVELTYKTAHGPQLPYWIGFDEKYIICNRPSYTDNHEVMASGTHDGDTCIRWYMLKPQTEDMYFFIHLCNTDSFSTHMPLEILWGEIPSQMLNYLISA